MKEKWRKYAELAVKVGVNLQPGQHLVIGFGSRQVYPEHIEFVRILTEVAYEAGARFVQVDWGDELWLKETVKHGDLDTLAARYKWQAEWVEQLAREGAAYIAIPASDPDLFDGMDSERVLQATKSARTAFQAFNQRRTNDDYSWSLFSLPTQAWADKVYPELPAAQRVDAMWKDILYCSRADGPNPVETWKEHLANLSKRADWMNDLHIHKLHYQAPGTDLTIELPQKHFWTAASKETPEGVNFVPNMPTEEVFSAPLKTGVNGTVSSTMPLNHNGALIDGIKLRFEGGRIVEYSAKSGYDALKGIIESDEGSHYLGELALVPVNSPISENGRLFYNTLFDENASCHLAIGMAYPLIENGRNIDRSEWEQHGLNDSLEHVDFMIGSNQLTIDAQTKDGKTVPIFRNGNWATSLT
ncbi:aminopeptidase [Alicyclobacillus sp. SO9]|uniref:aminopeptidase n=1 Tax=Alicyclobacillus sp. SO9 TaxID=2665646 RepID=UPI0018E77F98|nr:aminopeptidase [Alicyclobacillus sp. SO9]QQE77810.1 aminopeptidase [Alicyclobacillus sp. SO9]